jgi:hypothetical protein
MQADHQWAVSLEGDSFDLEDARELFGAGTELRICMIQISPDRNPTRGRHRYPLARIDPVRNSASATS